MPSVVTLLSSDGAEIGIDLAILRHLTTVKNWLNELGWNEEDHELIPLPEIHSTTIKKVLEWVEHHKNEDPFTEEMRKEEAIGEWDQEFFKQLDTGSLFAVVVAAHQLGIGALTHGSCLTVTGKIKGKTPEEIRDAFKVRCDFSEEEKEQIMRENKWLEEK